LDSTMDRFADAAIFAGVGIWALRHVDGAAGDVTAALALSCLVLGSIVLYAKARAASLGMTADGGLAERADRLVVILVAVLLVGLGLPVVILTVALVLLALASAWTVIQRVSAVPRQSHGRTGACWSTWSASSRWRGVSWNGSPTRWRAASSHPWPTGPGCCATAGCPSSKPISPGYGPSSTAPDCDACPARACAPTCGTTAKCSNCPG